MDAPVEIPTGNTIMPRHMAAIFDNLLAPVLGLLAAKLLSEEQYRLQLVLFVLVYLAYFFVFEVLTSRTPGKMLTGLVVVRKDGEQISTWDVVVRTLLRLLEVNPALLGAAPAAISILFSRHNQRIGDRLAGTIVVPTDRVA